MSDQYGATAITRNRNASCVFDVAEDYSYNDGGKATRIRGEIS